MSSDIVVVAAAAATAAATFTEHRSAVEDRLLREKVGAPDSIKHRATRRT